MNLAKEPYKGPGDLGRYRGKLQAPQKYQQEVHQKTKKTFSKP